MNTSIELHVRVNVRLGNDLEDKFLTGLSRSFSKEKYTQGGLPAFQSISFLFLISLMFPLKKSMFYRAN